MQLKPNKYFELQTSDSEESGELKNSSEVFISKYLNRHFLKIKSLPDDLQRLPAEEEFFFLQTDNSFNAFTFIPLIARHQGIEELHASTYSINIRVIESLVELYDAGLIGNITLMISDSLIKRNPTTIELLSAMASGRDRFRIQYAWNHSKVCIMKTAVAYYVVEGSGNWSENAFYEQYLFANCESLYLFRKSLFTEAKLR